MVCLFNDIHSNFILKKIFHNLDKKDYCQIIRYNKNLQKKLNITIKDYNLLYKIYSKIELEIIPTSGKIQTDEIIKSNYNESFYHITYNYENNKSKKIKINNVNIIKRKETSKVYI